MCEGRSAIKLSLFTLVTLVPRRRVGVFSESSVKALIRNVLDLVDRGRGTNTYP